MLLKAARSSLILALAGPPGGQALRRAEIVVRAAARFEVPLLILEGDLDAGAALAGVGAAAVRFAATAAGRRALTAWLDDLGREQLVLAGAVAAFDELIGGPLAALPGHSRYLVADAAWPTGAAEPRPDLEVVTSEMVVFEWLERADTQAFRDLLPLIK